MRTQQRATLAAPVTDDETAFAAGRALRVRGWYAIDAEGYEAIHLRENHLSRNFDLDPVTAEALVKLSDAQAALATKDEEIATLKRDASEMRQTMVAAAEEIHEHWAAHCDEEGYGPANLQNRLEGQYGVNYPGYTLGAFAALTAERDALRKAALKAAYTAFGMLTTIYPEDLPDDAQELAKWMVKKNLNLVPDDEGPEEFFIHIIRAAMARESAQ